jgi:hypothetical protein
VATVAHTTKVKRLPHVDNLRAFMVAWIIGGHALLGYSAVGGWPYDEVKETTLQPRSELALAVVLGPSALFVIGSFFFVSGLFSPGAMARKGPSAFATDRIVRLGVPWLAFMLLAWPFFMWLAYLAAGRKVSFWWEFTHRKPFLDAGPLWFAEVLVYVSVGYAIWTWAVDRFHRRPQGGSEFGARQLAVLVITVALASFIVRLWFPARSKQVLDLHLWQWPQCIAMFALGVAVARHGWAKKVPDGVRRGCGYAVVAVLVGVPVLAAVLGIDDVAADDGPFLGGWHWQAAVLAGIEAVLVVAGSVWLLGFAQRRMTGEGPVARACARGAFAAFLLQAPVLLLLAIALRPVGVPAEIKAVVVGGLSVPLCFWLGWLLVRRTPVGRLV